MAKAKRSVKDSVFRDLFGKDRDAKINLLSLYNALFNAAETDPEQITNVSLDDTVFAAIVNDVAFTIGDRSVVLAEHQSTVNENMPLRMLLYIGREYERMTKQSDRYRKALITVPTPEFVVFYNGTDSQPAERVMKLSDAYATPTGSPALELTVKQININVAVNHSLLQKCSVLREYAQMVEITRQAGRNNKDMKEAIEECIRRGILTDYLSRKAKEVINMLISEYNYEDDLRIQRQEAAEAAAKAAAEVTAKQVRQSVFQRMIALGYNEEEAEKVAFNE